MRKLSFVLLFFILALTVSSQTASAGSCASGTLDVYTAPGFSCTIGDKTFSNFSYVSTAVGGAISIPASGVAVVPQTAGGEIGLLFSAGWAVTSNQIQDSLIGYTVTAGPGFNIDDAVLSMGGAGFTGAGIAQVLENLNNGANLLVHTDSSGTSLSDSASFAGVSSLTIAFKDVSVSGGSSGTAGISAVTNLFSQTTPTPEPASILLLSSGLVAFGGMLRRRKSGKSLVA